MTPPPPDGPPPPPGQPPTARVSWAAIDQMKDEDVLRFAPPEIRRVWKRVVSVEEQLLEIKQALQRIEELLRARPGSAP